MSATVYGVAELARAAGVKPRTIASYLSRGRVPEPDARLECGPVWFGPTIEPWIAARDSRLAAIVESADAVIATEVNAATEYVNFQIASKRETAKRNVHNARVRRGEARTRAPGYTIKGKGLVLNVRAEARQIAESLVGRGDSSVPVAVIDRRDWAARLLQRRDFARVGAEDGIPF